MGTTDSQDGWKIETRKRLSGKLKGGEYKVFISPCGTKYYSMAKAIAQGGLKRSDSKDGRKNKKGKPKAKAKSKGK